MTVISHREWCERADRLDPRTAPPGAFNVVHGRGETAGRALGGHPRVDAIAFTGSGEVGRR